MIWFNYKYTTNAIAANTVADIASWTPIVNTDDATLIMPLEEAERVNDIVNQLKNSGMDDFL